MAIVEKSPPSQGVRPPVCVALVALGFLPLLYWHLAGLLTRPHYQFLLLWPVAAWILYGTCVRVPEEHVPAGKIKVAGGGLLAVCLMTLVVSAWYWSPWLAAVSALGAALGMMLSLLGVSGLVRWFPLWLFCLILVPFPFGLDEKLVVRLRGLTTKISSKTLDWYGILHQSYSNVIELPGKPLFVADACSGIHSLYVLLATALFVCAWYRRSLIHSLLLLGTTFGLVLVENVLRIFAVAFAWTKGIDLSTGSPHFALGAVLFCFSGLIIFSLDQFILFVLPEDWVPYRLFTAKKANSAKISSDQRAVYSPMWLLILSGLFVPVGVLQLFRMPSETPQFMAMFQQDIDVAELGADTLPEEISGFKRESFRMIDRVVGDPFGQASQQWVYRKGSLTANISLDYPFAAPHDLCQCYSLIGWKVKNYSIADAAEGVPSSACATLQRDFYGKSLLFFSQFDLQGQTTAAFREERPTDGKNAVSRRLESLREGKTTSKPDLQDRLTGPVLQVQMNVSGFDEQAEISNEAQAELLGVYHSVREVLIQRTLSEKGVRAGSK